MRPQHLAADNPKKLMRRLEEELASMRPQNLAADNVNNGRGSWDGAGLLQ